MMQGNKKNAPIIPLDVEDTEETREPTGEDLRYNEEEDSFELEPETEDAEYQHPEPYDTTAPAGEDDNSTYDEENPYTPDEYRDKEGELKGELKELDKEVADDTLTLDEKDEQLADTPEDEREDLDEEGYPRRDDAGRDDNSIIEDPDSGRPQDDPNLDILPEEVPPRDERDPLGDKQIQSDDPTEPTG